MKISQTKTTKQFFLDLSDYAHRRFSFAQVVIENEKRIRITAKYSNDEKTPINLIIKNVKEIVHQKVELPAKLFVNYLIIENVDTIYPYAFSNIIAKNIVLKNIKKISVNSFDNCITQNLEQDNIDLGHQPITEKVD